MTDDILAVVLAIVRDDDGRFLLVKRQQGDFQGLYGFPGGKVEVGEHLSNAIRREVREETGIETSFTVHRGVVSELIYGQDGTMQKHLVLTICRLAPDRHDIPHSHSDVADWYTLDEIRSFRGTTIPSLLPIVEAFTGDVKQLYHESKIVMTETGPEQETFR
jgi:mutator protein MutT